MLSTQWSTAPSALDEIPLLYVPERGLFQAKHHFVKGLDRHSGLRVTGISQNIDEWCLDGEGKVEEPAPRTVLQYRDIQTRSTGIAVANELRSGEAVLLSQIHYVAAVEPKIGKGKFLVGSDTEGKTGNVFPFDDIHGIRRLLYVFHHLGGIAFAAIPVPAPGSPLPEGHRAFFRYRCN